VISATTPVPAIELLPGQLLKRTNYPLLCHVFIETEFRIPVELASLLYDPLFKREQEHHLI
jgi:hypothetical protein